MAAGGKDKNRDKGKDAKDATSKDDKGGIPDPFAAFRQFLDTNERKLNQILADRSTEDTAKASRARSANAALDGQNVVQNLWGRYFEGINVASRTDVLHMGDRLSRIEEGLARLEARMAALELNREAANDPAAAPAPARKKTGLKRTRRPPSESKTPPKTRSRPKSEPAKPTARKLGK